jgi:ketosteroid isomerase-like protein
MIRLASFAFVTLLVSGIAPAAEERTPQAVADELLAADRAFSASSTRTDLVSGLGAMFSDDITLMVPGKLVQGRAAALELLRSNADNLKTHVQWDPKRAGVSADGQHGFTFGFFMAEGPDGKTSPGKYLAYWVKGPSGWRVAAYKRGRAAGEVPMSLAVMPPSLPATLVTGSSDKAAVVRYGESLSAAEAAFSKDAQTMGLGPAFAKHGSADAINLGGPTVPGFVVGNDAIGTFIGQNSPGPKSPLSWGADRVLVASSGDLGITFGMIHENTPAAGAAPQTFPFFTIWRRATTADPWKYIAE